MTLQSQTSIPLALLLRLNATRHEAGEPTGTYISPVDLDAPIATSKGKATGWWKSSGPTIAGGIQKAGGVPITVTPYFGAGYPTSTQEQDLGGSGGGFSWTGTGPAGRTSGVNVRTVTRFTNDMSDGGYDIGVAANQWPDYQLLRVFSWMYNNRKEQHIVTIAGDPDVVSQTTTINAGSDGDYKSNFDWANTQSLLTEVIFASRLPAKVLNYRLRVLYEQYTGIQAVQLFDLKPLAHSRGGNALAGAGYFGPLGSR